jgi:hypothetical protein
MGGTATGKCDRPKRNWLDLNPWLTPATESSIAINVLFAEVWPVTGLTNVTNLIPDLPIFI